MRYLLIICLMLLGSVDGGAQSSMRPKGPTGRFRTSDATTNTVTNMLTLTHTGGTVAAGFGTGIVFELEDAGGVEEQAYIDALMTQVTDSDENANMVYGVNSGGALTEAMRIVGWAGETYLVVGGSESGQALQALTIESQGPSTDAVGVSQDTSQNVLALISASSGNAGQFVLRTHQNVTDINLESGSDASYINSGHVGFGTTVPAERIHIDEAGGTDGTGSWIGNGSVSTSDASATTVYTLGTASNKAYRILADIVGAQDDGSNSMGALHSFTIKNVGDTVTEQGDASIQETDDSAGVSVSGVVSGTDYLIQVTGINPENWNWEVTVRVTVVAH